MSQQVLLTDNDKIALARRLRRILILTLLDYFNGTTDFYNLVIKELNELFEGIVNTIALNLKIIDKRQIRRKGFYEIIKELSEKVPNIQDALMKVINFYSQPLTFHGYQITIRDLRNVEAHGLSIPILPLESIIDAWRITWEFIDRVDSRFNEFLYSRNEFRDIYHMYRFLKIVLLGENENVAGF